MVEVSVTVGKLDASLALLLTKDHHLIEFPTLLLPNDVEAGSMVTIRCARDEAIEKQDKQSFDNIQHEILSTFGVKEPQEPVLKVRNVTQTSVVLEWDPINIATADILSLTLFKNGQRFGLITSPLKRTSTKISGLAIDNAYSFHLVLATTAGVYTSNKVTVKTHKMTDLSGITICLGNLQGSEIDEQELAESCKKIGAKPIQKSVKVDTTHFVCTVGEGTEWKRAQDLNIPVVTPEWVKACENERRLVGVKRYYLDADPKDRPPLQRSRAPSATTTGSVSAQQTSPVDEQEQTDVRQDEDHVVESRNASEVVTGMEENQDHDQAAVPELTITDAPEAAQDDTEQNEDAHKEDELRNGAPAVDESDKPEDQPRTITQAPLEELAPTEPDEELRPAEPISGEIELQKPKNENAAPPLQPSELANGPVETEDEPSKTVEAAAAGDTPLGDTAPRDEPQLVNEPVPPTSSQTSLAVESSHNDDMESVDLENSTEDVSAPAAESSSSKQQGNTGNKGSGKKKNNQKKKKNKK